MDYKGYMILPARNTGGKAGKNNNRTSTIQIIQKMSGSGYLLKKSIPYDIDSPESKEKAIEKAKHLVDLNKFR